jgi:hypothetical protein
MDAAGSAARESEAADPGASASVAVLHGSAADDLPGRPRDRSVSAWRAESPPAVSCSPPRCGPVSRGADSCDIGPCGPVPPGAVPPGPVPAGAVPRGVVRCGSVSRCALPPPVFDSKPSSALNASWTADATASPAPDSCPPMPGPESRIRRAARQMGHHWHSGASPSTGGISFVTVSQTSVVALRPPPKVRRTCPLISLRTFFAPWRMSQRFRSPIRSGRGGGLCLGRSAPSRPISGCSVPDRSVAGRRAPCRSVPCRSVPCRSDGSEGPDCSVIGVTISRSFPVSSPPLLASHA